MNAPSDTGVFRDFINASASTEVKPASPLPAVDRVAVLGGGDDARLLAALCLAEGAEVRLFSAYAAELQTLSRGIEINEQGPLGNYHVRTLNSATTSPTTPAVMTTGSIDHALVDANLVFLTGPVHKQRTYAMVLADHLQPQQIVVLPEARTFGAFEAAQLLRTGGANSDITLMELQGLPYWIHCDDAHAARPLNLQPVPVLLAAAMPAARTSACIQAVQRYLPMLEAAPSALHSALHDISASVDIPALLLGGAALSRGGKSVPPGGKALAENNNFHQLIGAEQRQVIAQLLQERHNVAASLGIRDLPDADVAIALRAGSENGVGTRPVPTRDAANALVRDGILGSLAPLLDLARAVAQPAPLTESMIRLGESILGNQISLGGRNLAGLGVCASAGAAQDIFTQLESLSKTGLS